MRISIITVTYNAEATIERTLQSVAVQTHPDMEHIVVDGASSDRTVQLVRLHGYSPLGDASSQKDAGRGNRLFVSEPDRGLYDAMNKGLRLATGDFLCFLNAGDKLHSPDTLAHVARAATEQGDAEGVGIVYGNTIIVDDDGCYLRPRHLSPPRRLTWRSFQHGMLVCHQAFYVRRRIAQSYDLTYRFSADFDWCIRCMREGERQGLGNVYLHETVADYLSEGLTTANRRASLIERFRIMSKHYGLALTTLRHVGFLLRTAPRS